MIGNTELRTPLYGPLPNVADVSSVATFYATFKSTERWYWAATLGY